jgi:CO/xanthine dehydrogenase FAD-binding subunit
VKDRRRSGSDACPCRYQIEAVACPPMKPPPFAYECPADLESTLELLSESRGEAKVLAGGQSLVPLLNFRLVRPRLVVDVNRVSGLDSIRIEGGALHVGALVRHSSVQHSPEVALHAALMAEAVPHIGHAQIRNRGTIGGSLVHADPAAELPAVLLAHGARFHVRSVSGSRAIDHREFFLGPFTTALREDELLTSIEIPLLPEGTGHSFQEFARRRGDFALGGAAVLVTIDADGRCSSASIALVAADATPVRAPSAEEALVGEVIDEAAARRAAGEAVADISPLGDIQGGSDFRRGVIRELVRRALVIAAERASLPDGEQS